MYPNVRILFSRNYLLFLLPDGFGGLEEGTRRWADLVTYLKVFFVILTF